MKNGMMEEATRVQRQIERMTRRLVRRFDPEKIILFGSHARGTPGPNSDVDLLVVLPISGSKRQRQLDIRLALHDIRVPKDIIVSTPEEFAWRRDIVGTMEYPAVREGIVLYDRG
jgi:predicted nucleotidyltransferase